jgi:hypothetical protein
MDNKSRILDPHQSSAGDNQTDICIDIAVEPVTDRISKYLIPILVFIGIIGNTLILITLNSRRKMKTKTNLLLSLMAFSDLIHALCTFVYKLPLYQDYIDFQNIYPSLQLLMLSMMRWSGTTSNWWVLNFGWHIATVTCDMPLCDTASFWPAMQLQHKPLQLHYKSII